MSSASQPTQPAITDINDHYDDIITSHPEEMLQAVALMQKQLATRGCRYGDDVIPCFLKPYFLSSEQTEHLHDVIDHLTSMVEKVTHLYFEQPETRALFGLTPEAAELVEIDPGYRQHVVVARPDAFLNNGDLRFIEINCDSPAGAAFSDVEESVFLESYPFRQAEQAFIWQHSRRRELLLEGLLAGYRAYGGHRRHPHIAIVDWRDVSTTNEFVLLQQFFQERGYETVIADPRDLRLRRRHLEHDGFRVDLIYRRVIFHELLKRLADVQDFLQAYRRGLVCVVNSLRSRLAATKAVLAVLSNPRYEDMFTEEENTVCREYIPWTRRLIDAEKFYGGRQVFLRDFVVDHQEMLVLKPTSSYGGRDVTIGRETASDVWRQLVDRVLEHGEHWVVQEYVNIPQMTVPVVTDGQVSLAKKKVNFNPFVFNGRYAGAMARLSDNSVINVSAGGGLIPAIAYEPKAKAV